MAERDDVLPKYLQISGYLRAQIECGELAPGAEVPSEREIAAAWKVARPTAAKALNTLRQQGIVRSRRGSGTYVADRVARMRESAPRYGALFPADGSLTVLESALVEGPHEVTDVLGLPAGAMVVMRTESSADDSGDKQLLTSWFPGEFAESAAHLLVCAQVPGGISRYLESATGREIAVVRERIGARLATAGECELLGLSNPAAVSITHRICLDRSGVVLIFREAVHPTGRWVMQQEYFTSSVPDFHC
ncbi:GntR family transcriptional regulator [Nocardia sp. 004]|uniref:GntR family transcriptional regulator n=1 Tax=Nocardia sp. 004 TaxID=3385978 RepID=UPI0039A3956A